MSDEPDESKPRRHLWPWIILLMFLVGVTLAILWMYHEVQRIQRNKRYRTGRVDAPLVLPRSPGRGGAVTTAWRATAGGRSQRLGA